MKTLLRPLAVLAAAAGFWLHAGAEISRESGTETIDDYTWSYTKVSGSYTDEHGDEISVNYVCIDGVTYDLLELCGDVAFEIPEEIDSAPVEEIGEGAFADDENVTYVYIPATVEIIRNSAFNGCSALEEIEFEDAEPDEFGYFSNLLTIEESAFANCDSLEGVELPPQLTAIGAGVFAGCDNLDSIDFTADEDAFGECDLVIEPLAFAGLEGLTSVSFPEYPVFNDGRGNHLLWDVIICEGAFEDCTSLESVEFGNAVYRIEDGAFYGAESLGTVEFRDTCLDYIGEGAFEACTALEEAFFPATLEHICSDAFAGCTGLSTVQFDSLEPEYNEFTDPQYWFKTTLSIGESAFVNCESLVYLELPPQLAYIGGSAFEGCTALEEVEMLSNQDVWEGGLTIDFAAFNGCESLKYLSIEDHQYHSEYDAELQEDIYSTGFDATIGEMAFSGCTALEDVYLGIGVSQVGESAFSGCEALGSVNFPFSINYVDSYAFGGCTSLWEVVLADSDVSYLQFTAVVGTEEDSFEDTPWANIFDLDIDEDGILWGYIGIPEYDEVELEIPEGVVGIAAEAFRDCGWIQCVDFPASVAWIGSAAFADCCYLTEVYRDGEDVSYDEFASTLLMLEEDAFDGTPWKVGGLLLDIDDDGVLVGWYGAEPDDYFDLVIPDGVVAIDYSAFEELEFLRSVTIPEGVERIGENAFRDCFDLEEVIFEGDMGDVYIEPGAFWNTPFFDDHEFTLLICDGVVTGFLGSDVPEYLSIPYDVCEIGRSAFDWDYYSYEYGHIDPDTEDYVVDGEGSLVDDIVYVRLPETVDQIDAYAFYGATYLERVIIGNMDVQIDCMAFADCESLEGLHFVDSDGYKIVSMTLTGYDPDQTFLPVGESMTVDPDFPGLFAGNVGFSGVWVTFNWEEEEFALEIDEDGTLEGWYGMPPDDGFDLVIPDGVVAIDDEAFWGCDWIGSVTIPASVKSIGEDAFIHCSNLDEVTFEGDMNDVYIGPGAFWDTPFFENHEFTLLVCDGVVTGFLGSDVPGRIEIPDGVTEIGFSAFDWDYYCHSTGHYDEEDEWIEDDEWSIVENIQEVVIPATVGQIATYAFYYNTSLESVVIDNPSIKFDGSAFKGCGMLEGLTVNNPGYGIDSVSITAYMVEYTGFPMDETVTVDLDFSRIIGGDLGMLGTWIGFNWRELTVVRVDAGIIQEALGLLEGRPYGNVLDSVTPISAYRGRSFDGWLVNGESLAPERLVRADDFVSASWREFNPLYPTEVEQVNSTVANIYDGYLIDMDGDNVGTIQVKVGKAGSNGESAVSATVQVIGARKISGFKAVGSGKVKLAADAPTEVTLAKAGLENITLEISANGLYGSWGDLTITGSRNFARVNAAAVYKPWVNTYNVAFETTGAQGTGAAFAEGYSTVSVTVDAKGKAKFSGTMADGTKVKGNGQLLVGADGKTACVNVLVPLYASKAGGFGFLLWLSNDGRVAAESISDWNALKAKVPFTATLESLGGSVKGGAPSGNYTFSLVSQLPETLPNAGTVQTDLLPTNVSAVGQGTKFEFAKANKIKVDKASGKIVKDGDTDNDAAIKLNCAAKDSTLKGTFYVYALNGSRLKKVKATVTGAMVNGSGYGTALIKNVGTFKVSVGKVN